MKPIFGNPYTLSAKADWQNGRPYSKNQFEEEYSYLRRCSTPDSGTGASPFFRPKRWTTSYTRDARALVWDSDPNFIKGELGTSCLEKTLFMIKEAASKPFGTGGVGALHWSTHTKAIRAHWLFRYLDPTQGQRKILLDHWICKGHREGRGILLQTDTGKLIDNVLPEHHNLRFFKEAILTFRSLPLSPQPHPSTGPGMAAEPIWNSELIERHMFNNAEVSALRHLDFLRGADLWCEES